MTFRDSTEVGQISKPPYFWGPFNEFQPIKDRAFDSDYWLIHSKNIFNDLISSKSNISVFFKFKTFLKVITGFQIRKFLPHSLIKILKGGSSVLDIGGGWGDNYLKFHKYGLHFNDHQYAVLDNSEQCDLGRGFFSENQISFYNHMPSKQFDIVFLIGTLQYIEDWKSIFQTFDKLGCKYVYIERTPFVSDCDTYCVVQSITPSTIKFKIGEENLNIISDTDFYEACSEFGWKIDPFRSQRDYSANFIRMPKSHQKVFYQRYLLTKI